MEAFLEQKPEPLRAGADVGQPIMLTDAESAPAKAFLSVAERTAAQVSIQSFAAPSIIPLKAVN